MVDSDIFLTRHGARIDKEDRHSKRPSEFGTRSPKIERQKIGLKKTVAKSTNHPTTGRLPSPVATVARHWLSKAGHHRRDDPQLSPAGHLGAAELAAKCHQLHQERRGEPMAELGRFSCWEVSFFLRHRRKLIGFQIRGDLQKTMKR